MEFMQVLKNYVIACFPITANPVQLDNFALFRRYQVGEAVFYYPLDRQYVSEEVSNPILKPSSTRVTTGNWVQG